MAFIPAPNVSQFVISGRIGTQPWNVILHFYCGTAGTAWTTAQLNAMSVALMAGANNTLLTRCSPDVTLVSCTGVDIGTSTPQIGSSTSNAGTGSASGESLANTSFLMYYPTNQRYRGGKGRSYLPGFSSTLTSDGVNWSSTAVTAAQNAWNAGIGAALSAALSNGQPACAQCIPMYNYTVVDNPAKKRYDRQKASFKAVGICATGIGRTKIATQRRRIG